MPDTSHGLSHLEQERKASLSSERDNSLKICFSSFLILSLSHGPLFSKYKETPCKSNSDRSIAFSLESEEVGGFAPLMELLNANLTPNQRGIVLTSSVVGVGQSGCALVQVCFSKILYLHSKVIDGQHLEISQGKCYFL